MRDQFGPVTITSGLRSGGLNAVVGGKETSQHLNGNAVDFVVNDPFHLVQCYYEIIRGLPFDQVIYYNNDIVKNRFIHVSLVENLNRRHIMIYECGRFWALDYWLKTALSL